MNEIIQYGADTPNGMKIGSYVRVSTEYQSLNRQLEKNYNYIVSNFDVVDGEREVEQHQYGYGIGDIHVFEDKQTGTDVERKGYKDLMDSVESGVLDAVVASSVSRVSRSIRDLDRSVERLRDSGVSIHFVDETLDIDPNSEDPFQNAMFRLLGVFAQLEAEMAQQRTKEGIASMQNADEEYHHGRAPLGFEKDDGKRVYGEDYDRVCTVLEMVSKDQLSKRKAADRLNCGRPTIDRALDRGELYGL